MHLKKLEIIGFKSFAKKTVFEFEAGSKNGQGITAIVGPNGSGKSNISDAIRWVLGEQSLKLLRGRASEDVIFSGSSTHKRLNFAEVTLVLNNEDKHAPIDYIHLALSRKLYRNGTSEYLMNNVTVRREDVILLLAQCNIAVKNYAVIGQGMIDQVIQATAFDRKDFFDEATGVKEFQIKKHKAQNRLLTTTRHLEETALLLHELKPRLAYLEKQFKKYNERERLMTELHTLQLDYYGGKWFEVTNRAQEKSLERDLLRAQSEEIAAKRASLQKEFETVSAFSSSEEEYQKLQSRFKEISLRKASLLQEQLRTSAELETAYEAKGFADMAWIHHRAEELKTALSYCENRERELGERAQSLRRTRDQKEKEKHTLFPALDAAKAELAKMKQQLSERTSTLDMRKELGEIIEMQTALIASIRAQKPFAIIADASEEIRNKTVALSERMSESGNLHVQAKMKIMEEQIHTLALQKEEKLYEQNELSFQLTVTEEKRELAQNEMQRIAKERDDLIFKSEKHAQENAHELEKQLRDKLARLAVSLEEAETQASLVSKKIQLFNQKQEDHNALVRSLHNERDALQAQLNHINNFLSAVNIDLAKLETQTENLRHEIDNETESPLRGAIYATSAPKAPPQFLLILKIKKTLEFIGGIDTTVTQEYHECKERFTFLSTQSEDLSSAVQSLQKIVVQLEKKIDLQFHKNFALINKNFSHYFQILFRGGAAELKQIEEPDSAHTALAPQAEEDGELESPDQQGTKQGVEIFACPPGKKIQSIALLSGGEKSLVSIALICAIIAANPPPFVLFDEVDAALDEANSHRFTEIIAELAHKTQFIAITHNRATMEKADILYGVTMKSDGISNLFSLKIEDAASAYNKKGLEHESVDKRIIQRNFSVKPAQGENRKKSPQ